MYDYFASDLAMVLQLNYPSQEIFSKAHVAKFTSPVFQITQPSCIAFAFVAQSTFLVKLGYLVGGIYQEKLLHRNLAPMGNLKKTYAISRDVGVLSTDGQQFVLVLEARCTAGGEQFSIDDVNVTPQKCTGKGNTSMTQLKPRNL